MAAPALPTLPPPFVNIEGLVNLRAVGGFAAPKTKPVILYRSAELSRITPKGKEQLQALGIHDVFDFRADDEIASYKTPAPDVPGVKFHRTPVAENRAYDPASTAARMQSFVNDERAMFVKMNSEILETAGPAFEKVLRYMVENPSEHCLIHCTVGKDRTGIFTALILSILGVPDDEIAAEYALSTPALKPVMPIIIARFKQKVGDLENWDGFNNLLSSKPENMLAILHMVREKYGGAERWILSNTNLAAADLETLPRVSLDALATWIPQRRPADLFAVHLTRLSAVRSSASLTSTFDSDLHIPQLQQQPRPSMSTLTLSLLSPADADAAAAVQVRAMIAHAVHLRIQPLDRRPSFAQQVSIKAQSFRDMLAEGYHRIVKAEVEGPDGRRVLVGVADWILTAEKKADLPEGFVRSSLPRQRMPLDDEVLKGVDVELRKKVGLASRVLRDATMGEVKYWYLSLMFVDPAYQSRGIGKALLRWGLDQADAEGIPAYLEASDEGLPLYQKSGFEVVGWNEVRIDPISDRCGHVPCRFVILPSTATAPLYNGVVPAGIHCPGLVLVTRSGNPRETKMMGLQPVAMCVVLCCLDPHLDDAAQCCRGFHGAVQNNKALWPSHGTPECYVHKHVEFMAIDASPTPGPSRLNRKTERKTMPSEWKPANDSEDAARNQPGASNTYATPLTRKEHTRRTSRTEQTVPCTRTPVDPSVHEHWQPEPTPSQAHPPMVPVTPLQNITIRNETPTHAQDAQPVEEDPCDGLSSWTLSDSSLDDIRADPFIDVPSTAGGPLCAEYDLELEGARDILHRCEVIARGMHRCLEPCKRLVRVENSAQLSLEITMILRTLDALMVVPEGCRHEGDPSRRCPHESWHQSHSRQVSRVSRRCTRFLDELAPETVAPRRTSTLETLLQEFLAAFRQYGVPLKNSWADLEKLVREARLIQLKLLIPQQKETLYRLQAEYYRLDNERRKA
uniref:Tyrosine specific protein phosphatases domain-containing protein n=1 Tax=Mycena chlorophos TaxID=658473 RepID=A0ABQ0LK73_MYCCL|nr:predicted protein [Mycena chlorophos]